MQLRHTIVDIIIVDKNLTVDLPITVFVAETIQGPCNKNNYSNTLQAVKKKKKIRLWVVKKKKNNKRSLIYHRK